MHCPHCGLEVEALDVAFGYVVAGGTTFLPRVRLAGDATYQPTPNFQDVALVAGDRVAVLVKGTKRIMVIGKPA